MTKAFDELKQKTDVLEKKVNDLEILNSIGQKLSESLELSALLKEILDLVYQSMHFSRCAVMLIDPTTKLLRVKSAYGFTKESLAKVNIAIGTGITGWVAKYGVPLLVPNVRKDRRYVGDYQQVRSEVAAPLIVRGEVIGVLNAETVPPRSFTVDDLELFATFTSQVSSAIHNASLYQSIKQKNIILQTNMIEIERMNKELEDYAQKLKQTYFETIRSLVNALEARDPYTRGHSERVTKISLLLGKELKLTDEQMNTLAYASILHDIGKIGIRDNVLNKTTPLTEEDWKTIFDHPTFGDAILNPIQFLEKSKKAVLYHHERHDGTGYPGKLKGSKIPLLSRIISIADTFDAIAYDRIYRKGLGKEAAIAEIQKKAGSQFDPKVVRAFLKIADQL